MLASFANTGSQEFYLAIIVAGLFVYLWFSATAYKKRQERMIADLSKTAREDAITAEERARRTNEEYQMVMKQMLEELKAIRMLLANEKK